MTHDFQVAVVDDEEHMRQSIVEYLELFGIKAKAFDNAAAVLASIGSDFPGIVLSDIRMPVMDGITLMTRLLTMDPQLPVILITAHGDVPLAVQSTRNGAYDFLEKPFDPERLIQVVERAIEDRQNTLSKRMLRRELSDDETVLRKLVGSSQQMKKLREDILDLSQAENHVLLSGETGTGKTLVAHAIHACGVRQKKALVTVNCRGASEVDLEQRLFGVGHEGELPALITPDGGTLLLENVNHLPESLQSKLLSVLSSEDWHDPRNKSHRQIISTILLQEDENLPSACLIPDLYYRLAASQLTLPPLRDRGEDILELFAHYADIFVEEYGSAPFELKADDAAALLQEQWLGNVRQLINLTESVTLQNRRDTEVLREHLGNTSRALISGDDVRPLKDHVDSFERMLIDNALRRNNGSVAAVIKELSIPRRTLNEKMVKYNLSRTDYL